jgi:hypothetical protein
MREEISSKDKAKEALPLKSGSFPLKRDLVDEPKRLDDNSPKITHSNNTTFPKIEDLIGTRQERRECAVGVRVTRDMKDILENLSAKTRLSESEIVFRILSKNLRMDIEA